MLIILRSTTASSAPKDKLRVPVITPEPEMKMRVPPNAVLGEEEENDEDDEMNRPVL
jgi:hypothetical protein